jgi:hypothetical protein
MKPRKLKLIAEVSGFPTAIAEVHIQNFASEAELKDWTDLVCPTCLEPTEYKGGGYECKKCNGSYSWWGKLLRVVKGTKTKVEMPRLLKEGEITVGKLYKMGREDFAKYCDATKAERGVIVSDQGSAHNLFKLLVATEKLDCVIITVYNDTTEQVVALLKVSASGRILLQEIIPANLVHMKDTLMLNRNEITEKDVTEAKAFVAQFIPEASEETLRVSDYRTAFLDEHVEQPEKETAKVVQIKEIMAKVKA